MTYLLAPKISSHLSRHDMTYLSGSHILSYLSRFIFDMTPPKIELFVAKNVATNSPRASPRRPRAIGLRAYMTRHAARQLGLARTPTVPRSVGTGGGVPRPLVALAWSTNLATRGFGTQCGREAKVSCWPGMFGAIHARLEEVRKNAHVT